MTLLFFVLIETPFVPFSSNDLTISLLKSIRTFSTIFIIFLSVTLKPLINFDLMFDLSNSLFILGPPPCTTITESPNSFNIFKSDIKLLKISLSINTLPPYFITINSFLYF